MEKREKIKQIYQKLNITVGEDYIDGIMENKDRVKDLMRVYKQEEMKSMNYILGKPEDNKVFTKYELEVMNKIDLFNKKVVEWCKLIWDNRNHEENLEEILNALTERRCPKCM